MHLATWNVTSIEKNWFCLGSKSKSTFLKLRINILPFRYCLCNSYYRCWDNRRWATFRHQAPSPANRCTCSCFRCWFWSNHLWRGGNANTAVANEFLLRTVQPPRGRSLNANLERAFLHRNCACRKRRRRRRSPLHRPQRRGRPRWRFRPHRRPCKRNNG